MSSENINNFVESSDEISLKELIFKIREWWKYLFSKWLIIMICGFIGGVLGFVYAYYKKPVYTATTTFVLEDEKSGSGLGNLAGLASIAGFDLGGSGGGVFQGDNILGLYKSRTMLERTLLTPVNVNKKEELLVERYISFNKLREKWSEEPALAELQFSIDNLKEDIKYRNQNRLRDSVLGVIVNDINKNYLLVSKPDKKLSAIQVDVKAEDELFAKAFNDKLVKNVNDFYVNTKTKKTTQNVRILEHKRDSVRDVMNGAIYSAVAIGDATPNLNPTRQIQRVAPAQRAQFSAETNKSILGELVKNLELTKMSLLKETPLIQVIDEPVFPLEKQKLGKVKGFILGGFLFGFIGVFGLLVRKMFIEILK